MKRLINISLLFSLILLLLISIGCSNAGKADDLDVNPGVDKPLPGRDASSYEGVLSDGMALLGANDTELGNVVFWRDGEMLSAEFSAGELNSIADVQLCVGNQPPSAGGPGEFPYFEAPSLAQEIEAPAALPVEPVTGLSIRPADPLAVTGPVALPIPLSDLLQTATEVQGNGQSSCTATVSLAGLVPGEQIYVAASADILVERPTGTETLRAWARTATVDDWYFEYPRMPNSNLPEEQVLFIAESGGGAGSTWASTFQQIPEGCDVVNDHVYEGWCVDLGNHLSPGVGYNAKLYSSYSPDLPGYCQDNDWDMVNYIINHKQGNRAEIQHAIWYFIGGGGYPPAGPSRDMVDEALEHGEGYVPMVDDVLAVLVAVSPNVQSTIIVIDVEQPVM